jgi:hypothetical protein
MSKQQAMPESTTTVHQHDQFCTSATKPNVHSIGIGLWRTSVTHTCKETEERWVSTELLTHKAYLERLEPANLQRSQS